jgi:hypothetical protein
MKSQHLDAPLRLLRALSFGLLIAALALAAGLARAADEDPPGRVGRLADLQGSAWLWNRDTGEWTAAERNAVLTTGDRIATDPNGRAEVRVGSTTFRLDGGSELELSRVDDARIDATLHDGSTAVRVRNPDKLNEISVATGEGRFTFQRTGRYRIDRQEQTSFLTVDSGRGLYEGPRSALTVNSGQRAEFWLDGGGVAQYAITDPVRDAFAAWTGERDRAEDVSTASRYVSPEMTGAEDLDRYGRWQQSPEYGAVWYPTVVAPGWAPYSTGRWAYVRPWGWTWVDDAPWGFAPFHYGRWVSIGGTWAWAPGQRVLRPVYAPALVAWIGGPNFSLSISSGPAVGWFPLAPREVWVPWYRTSPVYVRQVNVTHVTNVVVIDDAVRRPPSPYDYRNRKFPHAVTVVPQSVVASRERVTTIAPRFRDDPEIRRIAERPAPTQREGRDRDEGDTRRVGANAFAPPVAAPVLPASRVTADPSTSRPPGARPLPPSRVTGTDGTPAARPERPATPSARAVPPGREVRSDRPQRNERDERSNGRNDGSDRVTRTPPPAQLAPSDRVQRDAPPREREARLPQRDARPPQGEVRPPQREERPQVQPARPQPQSRAEPPQPRPQGERAAPPQERGAQERKPQERGAQERGARDVRPQPPAQRGEPQADSGRRVQMPVARVALESPRDDRPGRQPRAERQER